MGNYLAVCAGPEDALPGWKVQAELPGPVNFEAATATVHAEDVAIVQVGPDQEGFLRFWKDNLRPALR